MIIAATRLRITRCYDRYSRRGIQRRKDRKEQRAERRERRRKERDRKEKRGVEGVAVANGRRHALQGASSAGGGVTEDN